MLLSNFNIPKWFNLLALKLFIYFLINSCFFVIGYYRSPGVYPVTIEENIGGGKMTTIIVHSKVQYAVLYFDVGFILLTVILLIVLVIFYFWVVNEYY